MKFTTGKIIQLGAIVLIAGALTTGNVVAMNFKPAIDNFLCPSTSEFEGEGLQKASALSDQLCRDLVENGIVMLKNEEIEPTVKSLPLSKDLTKVNVFGWSATNAGFAQKGIGSGSSAIDSKKSVSFLKGLTDFGVEYNTDIIKAYESFNKSGRTYAMHNSEVYRLKEPTVDFYSNTLTSSGVSLLESAKNFSDTAFVVVTRVSGENTISEVPTTQNLLTTEKGNDTDTTRTYLDTSKYEEDLIKMCSENFKNVVLIVNSANTMHLTCLEDDKIDSCIYVGLTGQSGAAAIPNVLWGYKKVKDENGNVTEVKVGPSGRTSDTYIYEPEFDAAFANHDKNGSHISYMEDIYIGYKWYETADVEGYWNGVDNSHGKGYDGVVQFPFGYGLSYSEFEWSLGKVTNNRGEELQDGSELSKYTTINVEVFVKNVGNVAAKEVVGVYATPPYTKGGIEKSAVNLMEFAKLDEAIEPGQTAQLTVSFDAYDMASYDCYDKNNNNFRGYELDPGDYVISLRSDAHTIKPAPKSEKTSITLKVAGESSEDSIRYKMDPKTKQFVKNRMTGEDAYQGLPIDGSTVGASQNYLTRADFANTMPKQIAPRPSSDGGKANIHNTKFPFDTSTMPTLGQDSNLRLFLKEDGSNPSFNDLSGASGASLVANDDLIEKLGNYRDRELWDKYLNQMTAEEIIRLVEVGGFHTEAVETIGKPKFNDRDGPAGFNTTIGGSVKDKSPWTAYPSETLIACTWSHYLTYMMGISIGLEGSQTESNGWYAPGVNLHRSAYNGRNYEYYSEDPILSGKLAAEVIRGAKTNGVYCYMKHFAASELGVNPNQVNTWLTEQNFRENYLKPFEIAVKEGGANAVMTSFNRIGGIWAGAYYPMLTQVLRTEWGFEGSVITDYQKSGMTELIGVCAGNDLWLTNSTSIALNASNPLHVNACRNACKNIIFTYVDTYLYAKNNDVDDSRFQVEVGTMVVTQADSWWIPAMYGIDAVVAVGLIVWALFIFLKKEKLQAATNATNVTLDDSIEKKKALDEQKKIDNRMRYEKKIKSAEKKIEELKSLIEKYKELGDID